MENQDGKWIVIDPQKWIDQLDAVLVAKPVADEKIDFKVVAERQANELKDTKSMLAALNERLAALESPKEEPVNEADNAEKSESKKVGRPAKAN